MDPTATDELVDRARRGDRAAFSALFREHRASVLRLVQRMTSPRTDPEDLVQEVFLQVYRSLPDFHGRARFSTWLHRVTVNVVLMARRAARSRPVLTEAPDSDREPSAAASPDELVMRQRRVDAFRKLLERLSEKKRVVYELHELGGLSPLEIGEIVGAPVLTVRTRLFYARRELAEMMRQEPALAGLAQDLGEGDEAGGSEDAS